MNTDPTISKAVTHFLDRVAEHLIAKTPAQRREILADLEAHIYEALQSRAQDRQPTLQDIQSVLAEMDPPESYIQSPETAKPQPATRRTMGIVALSISLGTVVLAVFIAILTEQLSHKWQGYLLDGWLAYLIFLTGQVTAFILGLIAWNSRFGKVAVIVSAALVILSLLLFICLTPVRVAVE